MKKKLSWVSITVLVVIAVVFLFKQSANDEINFIAAIKESGYFEADKPFVEESLISGHVI